MGHQSASAAQQVKDQAQEKAQEATQRARSTLRDQVDSRSRQAGAQVSQQASDIRSLSHELRTQGKDGPARIAEQAADHAEKVGTYLTQSDADRILRDAEDFARSNPWAVMAAGLAAGFLASRFLKASSSSRYRDRSTSSPRLAPATNETPDRFARPPHVGGAPAIGPATSGQI
jgi:ElaB/YqjD/DUF883 family membrane-anchored ribosome-binding protein